MKLVALSESVVDETAIRILAEAVLGREVTWQGPPRLQSRGWPAVLDQIPIVMKHAHYQTDATAVIVVVDTNSTPLHDPRHGDGQNPNCRLCRMRASAEKTLAQLSPNVGRLPPRVVFGAATPTIEAWYLCARSPYPSEQKWTAGGAVGYDNRSLKFAAYGVERASFSRMTEVAEIEAKRLATNLEALRLNFPIGFGALEGGLLALLK